jgi:nitrate reductase assembly molybdenum cofactor insertion protein NarJ
LGFAYPGEKLVRFLHDDVELPDGPVGRALQALRDDAADARLAALQEAYMRLFDPRRPPLLLEAEYRTNHFQQRTELLSDLMGFYRAFAVTPDNERPDHIACELDFLQVLSVKEFLALRNGRMEQAEICGAARRKFLDEHLLAWSAAVCGAVRENARPDDDRFYLLLVDGLEVVLRPEQGWVP